MIWAWTFTFRVSIKTWATKCCLKILQVSAFSHRHFKALGKPAHRAVTGIRVVNTFEHHWEGGCWARISSHNSTWDSGKCHTQGTQDTLAKGSPGVCSSPNDTGCSCRTGTIPTLGQGLFAFQDNCLLPWLVSPERIRTIPEKWRGAWGFVGKNAGCICSWPPSTLPNATGRCFSQEAAGAAWNIPHGSSTSGGNVLTQPNAWVLTTLSSSR